MLIDRMHGVVFNRRVRVLGGHVATLLPEGASVLDVGCGDGNLALAVQQHRPDVVIEGIDVLLREHTHIPVTLFDGATIPHGDGSFDVVLFVDVLHHTDDPLPLLREAARVARRAVVIKDHTAEGFLANPTLRFMDRVGNARFGVSLPYNYWRRRQWVEAFAGLGLTTEAWIDELGLYPGWANWVFGRSLHFIARLGVPSGKGAPA
jgi:SAM-dependent methyltransferase